MLLYVQKEMDLKGKRVLGFSIPDYFRKKLKSYGAKVTCVNIAPRSWEQAMDITDIKVWIYR